MSVLVRHRHVRERILSFVVLIMFPILSAGAQGQQGARPERGGRAEQRGGRAGLEPPRRLAERFAQVVQRQLGLDEAGMRKLQEVNRKLEPRRMELGARERELRQEIFRESRRGAEADQARVDRAMKEMIAVQRRRIDLAEEEQTELAKFLTPVQRARYSALRENLQRRFGEMRRQRGGGRGGPRRGGMGGPPPGAP